MIAKRNTRVHASLLAALVAWLFLGALAEHFRPFAAEGRYFQAWSSGSLMQTLPVEELRRDPVGSLWHLHIQPPVLDMLRALLGRTAPSEAPPDLVRHVDDGLFTMWALVYALLIGLVCWWVSSCIGIKAGLAAAALMALHPATLMYATLLDSTLLSTLGTLLLLHLLWRVYRRMPVPAWSLAGAFLFLHFTRSIFQWPWLPLLAIALLWMGYGRRNTARFLLMAAVPVALFAWKQHRLFGTTSTSTFTGMNLCRSIEACDPALITAPPPDTALVPAGAHAVLRRPWKAEGSVNYNHLYYLDLDRTLQQQFSAAFAAMDLRQLLRTYAGNLRLYLKPSSRYTPHAITDRVPWRRWYDNAASSPLLLVWLAVAIAVWWRRVPAMERLRALGLVMPVLALVFISVVFERGENMRFKYFVEPALFVFIFVEWYHLAASLRQRVLVRER